MGAIRLLARSGGGGFDKYVSQTGNDSNTGDSLTDSWATMDKVATYIQGLPSGSSKKIYVATGTYGGLQFIGINYTLPTNVEITFQNGCELVGTGVAPLSGINIANGGSNLTLTIKGNGLTIRDFLASSGNGIASTGNADSMLLVYNVAVTNCDDGISAHGNAKIKAYDSTFENCVKSAFAHVNTSETWHYRCTFTGRASAVLGIGASQSTVVDSAYFEDCNFVPISAGQVIDINNSILNRCKIGTASLRVAVSPAVGATNMGKLTDCFINLAFDAKLYLEWIRCYGYLTKRIRGVDSGTPSIFKNCVIVGNATGLSSGMIYGNNDPVDGNWDGYPIDIKDSVIMNFATAIGAGFSANQKTTFSASSFVRYCNLYNNTTDLASGITNGANNIDANPVLGSYAGSTNQADFAVTAAECIGTGSDGGNIGFTINDI